MPLMQYFQELKYLWVGHINCVKSFYKWKLSEADIAVHNLNGVNLTVQHL
jgi:hypothetical protein